jgi:hypothetical protein
MWKSMRNGEKYKYKWPLCKWVIPEVTFQEYIDLIKRNFEGTYKKEEMEVLTDAYEEERI